jgi:hypothetical protein
MFSKAFVNWLQTIYYEIQPFEMDFLENHTKKLANATILMVIPMLSEYP